ncbi:B-type cyclin [Coemansia erecta]|uniref:B-type cyclin n=1 Tax=Coemansia erecta TaxID=147472 RepID=A0A9W7Y511_9FUNG|nr:B-type cyclin [Coemansia erecta]
MDKQSEQRREYLYSNLSKQLTRLNQNFEQLQSNMLVMQQQAELAQRLALSHASMFMGAKDNKSSTMPLRSRIPGRNGAAITDENRVAARAGGKDLEPVGKAPSGKPRGALAMPTTSATIGIKAGAAVTVKSYASQTTTALSSGMPRPRNALSSVSQGLAASKIVKPSDAAPSNAGKPLTRSGRIALAPAVHSTTSTTTSSSSGVAPSASAAAAAGIGKPALGATRARQASAISRPTAMPARPSNLVANRPISKATSSLGVRRPRPVVASAASAVVPVTGSVKRPRSSASDRDFENENVPGKHTRSTRAVRPAAYRSDSEMSLGSTAEDVSSSEQASLELATSASSTTLAEPESESMQISTSPDMPQMGSSPRLDDSSELKFVDIDTIEYALSHSGPLNEHPIMMTEISRFEADIDPLDQSLVPEFSDDIFGYMRELEVTLMPDPNYIQRQPALTWSTRTILVEWLVQVHKQFNLLPETLYLCINFVDRFLSTKEIVINKLQLVGAVCLLLAAKYEEVHIPSIKDIEYMVENNYSEDEILRAERFILRMLDFNLGYPGPMSFLRRISKADEYDMATRTLSKYLIEVTLVDERFIGIPCSKVAAAAHYLAIRFLNKHSWTRAHAFYSGFFESELLPVVKKILQLLLDPRRYKAILEKYTDRKYLRAAEYVIQWFSQNQPELLLIPTGTDLLPEDPANTSRLSHGDALPH